MTIATRKAIRICGGFRSYAAQAGLSNVGRGAHTAPEYQLAITIPSLFVSKKVLRILLILRTKVILVAEPLMLTCDKLEVLNLRRDVSKMKKKRS